MAGLIGRFLPRLIKGLGPTIAKQFPKVSKALLAAAGFGGAILAGGLNHEEVHGDLTAFPPIDPIPYIPEGKVPRPSKSDPNDPPWVKGPKKEKRPPRKPPGHYETPLPEDPNRIKPGPEVPGGDYPLRAPPNSPRGPDDSGDPGDDPFGDDGDPWGGDDDEDREPEPGHPRPRKQWPPDFGDQPPIEDSLYEMWRAWIRLFRAWRHDTWATFQEIDRLAPPDMKTAIATVMGDTVSQIVNKPKKPFPIDELSNLISTTWYQKLKAGYAIVQYQPWAEELQKSYRTELLTMPSLQTGLSEIAVHIAQLQDQGLWVSHDFPGDPADITHTKRAMEVLNIIAPAHN